MLRADGGLLRAVRDDDRPSTQVAAAAPSLRCLHRSDACSRSLERIELTPSPACVLARIIVASKETAMAISLDERQLATCRAVPQAPHSDFHHHFGFRIVGIRRSASAAAGRHCGDHRRHRARPIAICALRSRGLVLFMFLIGLKLNLRKLRGCARTSWAISHVSIVAPFSLGLVLASCLRAQLSEPGTPFAPFALFLGQADGALLAGVGRARRVDEHPRIDGAHRPQPGSRPRGD